MHIYRRVIPGLIIGLVCASAGAGAFTAATAPANLEGAWEGFIAETPARLTRIGIQLQRAGESWEGTIDLPGTEGLPLSAIEFDGVDLHFELRVGEVLVVFDAESTASSISGRVVEGERAYTFDLQKLPAYPEPASRVEAWKQDLDVVRSRFLKYDRSFDPAARAAFGSTAIRPMIKGSSLLPSPAK